MATRLVHFRRDFASAATGAWLGLLILGALVGGFVLMGVLIGIRELASGLLHIYGSCRSLLRSPSEAVAVVASAGPALAFAAAAVGGMSSVWDAVRTRILIRRFYDTAFHGEPRVTAIARKLGVTGRIYVVKDPVPYALTAGLWRPRVFLSRGAMEVLEDDELEAVLRHELAHMRRRDPLKILLGRAVRRALFFIPLARDLWIRYVVASELAADASAVAAQGRSPLSRAVLRLLSAGPKTGGGRLSGFGPVSDVRVMHLLQPASVHLPPVGGLRLALSATMVLAVLGAVPVHSPPSFFDVLAHLGLTCRP